MEAHNKIGLNLPFIAGIAGKGRKDCLRSKKFFFSTGFWGIRRFLRRGWTVFKKLSRRSMSEKALVFGEETNSPQAALFRDSAASVEINRKEM